VRLLLLALAACAPRTPTLPANPPQPAAAPAPAPPLAPAPHTAAPGAVPAPAAPAAAAPVAAPRGRAGSDAEIAYCISETNRYRALARKPPLARNTLLDDFARDGARVDHQARESHRHLNTTPFPGEFRALAANELPWWHYEGPDSVRLTLRTGIASFWAEGPGGGHYENIVGNYSELGCGIWIEGDGITVVQVFRLP
jgi:uncharacterized protein YkwD